MLGKKLNTVKKLAKKAKVMTISCPKPPPYKNLVTDNIEQSSTTTPTGCFAVYVGEERQRFVVPTGFLNHPLFKMLLEKAANEFGFKQSDGLVVPCSVSAFEEVVSAIESCYGQFDLKSLVEEISL